MKRVSKRPVDHFEGKWEKGKKYTLYAIVKNNGTLFRSLTPKEKAEPYVIYDSTNETFSANAGWEIVELSEDSRMSAGGNISKQDVETALEPYAKSADLSTVATSGSYSDLSNIPTDLVKTSEQTFTEAQKSQARTNLGAASAEEVEALADQKYEGPYDDGELPSASADTMGAIYLVGPDNNDEYERFVTRLSGSTYSWVSLGMTSVNLANYATKTEHSQLEAKVDGGLEPIYTDLSVTEDKYYNTSNDPLSATPSAFVGVACCNIAVSPGEKYRIFGVGGNQYARLWVTADSQRNQVRKQTSTIDARTNPVIITIEEGEAYLVCDLNSYDSSTDKVQKVGYQYVPGLIEKVAENEQDIQDIKDVLENEVTGDVTTSYESGYINSSGGVSLSSYAKHSGFVPIEKDETFAVYTSGSSNWYAAFYSDANESSFISGQQYPNESGLVTIPISSIPYSARYIRVTLNSQVDNVRFIFYKKELINVGDIQQEISNIENALQTDETGEIVTTYESGRINSAGGVSSSTYAKHSDFVPIQENEIFKVYTTGSSNWYAAFYTEANESSFISAQQYPESNTLTTIAITNIPTNARYIRVTLTSQVDTARFLSKKKVLITMPKEYYVIPDGTGDYTGLVAALSDLRNDESPKIIRVAGGVYDIFSEMGGQTFIDNIPADVPASDWPIYSNFVPNNTAIVGDGEVTLNFFPPDSTPQEKMAVINPMAFRGSVTLENLTINASNCRYVIHDEPGATITGSVKKYKNVKAFKTGGGYVQCFAGGLSKQSTLIFEDCLFKSNGIAWYIHENGNGNGTILFSNCAFVSGGSSDSLYLKTDTTAPGKQSVHLNNCVLTGSIALKDSVSRPNKYDLLLIKSGTPTITSDSGTNPYPPTIIN